MGEFLNCGMGIGAFLLCRRADPGGGGALDVQSFVGAYTGIHR